MKLLYNCPHFHQQIYKILNNVIPTSDNAKHTKKHIIEKNTFPSYKYF